MGRCSNSMLAAAVVSLGLVLGAAALDTQQQSVTTGVPAAGYLTTEIATDDPTAATIGLLSESQQSALTVSCPASTLGYQCSQKVAVGVVLHYSYGGAGQPGNSCTQFAGLDTSLSTDGSMMHFAIESTQPGYAAVGFPVNPGKMAPADAVIGSIDSSTGAMQVEAYRLTSKLPSGVTAVKPDWITGMGAIRLAAPNKALVVCFSRPVTSSGLLLSSLDLGAVPIIWAAHTSNNRQEQHLMQGALSLNMQTGRSTVLVADDSYLPLHVRYAAQVAHGVLMVAACCVFLPAGTVVARHKWLFADKQTGKISTGWFKLHQSLQQAGIVSLVASFVVAMTLFCRTNGLGRTLHKLYTPHFGMGVALTAAALLQAILAAVRPPLMSKYRAFWKAWHYTLGYGIVGLGIANSYVGVVLAHDLKSMPWPAWLVPMSVMLGLIVLAGLGLEAYKIKLQVNGRYDASSHTITPCTADVKNHDPASAQVNEIQVACAVPLPPSPSPAKPSIPEDIEMERDCLPDEQRP